MRKVYKGNCQHLVKRKQKHHRKHKVKVLQGEDAYLPMRISRHLLKMTSCLLFSNTTVLLQMYSMPPSWPIWVAMAPGWGWMGRSAHHHHCCDHQHHHHHQVIIMTHDSWSPFITIANMGGQCPRVGLDKRGFLVVLTQVYYVYWTGLSLCHLGKVSLDHTGF